MTKTTEPQTRRLNLRLSDALFAKLQQIAKRKNRSMTNVIQSAIERMK